MIKRLLHKMKIANLAQSMRSGARDDRVLMCMDAIHAISESPISPRDRAKDLRELADYAREIANVLDPASSEGE